jgi:hypothetical protein
MCILGLYSYPSWYDDEDDDQEPDPIDGEALPVTGMLVWWSAPAGNDDE